MAKASKKKFSKVFLLQSLFAVFIAVGYFYLTPFISILFFKSAIESQETKKAEKYINFPSVRESLKDQLKHSVKNKIIKETSGNHFAEIGVILFNPILDGVIESTVNNTVTPQGLNTLLNNGLLSQSNPGENNKANRFEDSKEPEIKLYYESLNQFVLSSNFPEIEEPLKAFWHREGVIKWRLYSVELPLELINSI